MQDSPLEDLYSTTPHLTSLTSDPSSSYATLCWTSGQTSFSQTKPRLGLERIGPVCEGQDGEECVGCQSLNAECSKKADAESKKRQRGEMGVILVRGFNEGNHPDYKISGHCKKSFEFPMINEDWGRSKRWRYAVYGILSTCRVRRPREWDDGLEELVSRSQRSCSKDWEGRIRGWSIAGLFNQSCQSRDGNLEPLSWINQSQPTKVQENETWRPSGISRLPQTSPLTWILSTWSPQICRNKDKLAFGHSQIPSRLHFNWQFPTFWMQYAFGILTRQR